MKTFAIVMLCIVTYLLIGLMFSVAIHILHMHYPDVGMFDADTEDEAFLIIIWPVYLLICIVIGPIYLLSDIYEVIIALVDKALKEENNDTRRSN